jgi:hypothetical protein
VIADACGDISTEAHEWTGQRMIQPGAVPMTPLPYLLELKRDWIRVETHESSTGIAKQWARSYGLGATHNKTIFGSSENVY